MSRRCWEADYDRVLPVRTISSLVFRWANGSRDAGLLSTYA